MFSMIGHAVFGLLVGVVAKLLLPGHDPGGFIVTAIIGMRFPSPLVAAPFAHN